MDRSTTCSLSLASSSPTASARATSSSATLPVPLVRPTWAITDRVSRFVEQRLHLRGSTTVLFTWDVLFFCISLHSAIHEQNQKKGLNIWDDLRTVQLLFSTRRYDKDITAASSIEVEQGIWGIFCYYKHQRRKRRNQQG